MRVGYGSPMADYYQMSQEEVAWGWVPGVEAVAPDTEEEDGAGPVEVLEDILRPLLQRPPCVVEFSGGRDSSVLLAVAVRLARREGHPAPIPLTNVYTTVPAAREDEWQEAVIRHLGVDEWERREYDDEFDLIGPAAQRSLLEHGLVWPPTLHTRGPTWDLARGGAIVNGDGGDELMGVLRVTPIAGLVARNVHPRRAALRAAGLAILPRPVRRPVLTRRLLATDDRSWLRPAVRKAYVAAVVDDEIAEPLAWPAALRHHLRLRAVTHGSANLASAASRHDTRFVTPFLDRRFVAALGRTAGVLGHPGRTVLLKRLFGPLLPPPVLERTSKADLTGVYFHRHSREFANRWDGTGVDPELVDPRALRQVWKGPRPHAGTAALLQQAWLATNTENHH